MARCGGRPTVEGSITLVIRHLRLAILVPDCPRSGTLQWAWSNGSQSACQVEYDVTFCKGIGILHLANITRFDSFGKTV
ncbi:hypothetical protein DC522_06085 [Microvirga sp. KLBC 81]|nr:hypothetical protein DC522_06085 [Microvirga sp. KLBC 81]